MLDRFPLDIVQILLGLLGIVDKRTLILIGNRTLNRKMQIVPVEIEFGKKHQTQYWFLFKFYKNVKAVLFTTAHRKILALLPQTVEKLTVGMRTAIMSYDYYSIQPLPNSLTSLTMNEIPFRAEHAEALPKTLTYLRTFAECKTTKEFCDFSSHLPQLLSFRFYSQYTMGLNGECALSLPKSLTSLESFTNGGADDEFISNLRSAVENIALRFERPVSLMNLPPNVTSLKIYKSANWETSWTSDMIPSTVRVLFIDGNLELRLQEIEEFAIRFNKISIKNKETEKLILEAKERLSK
mgnify:FL=1